MPDEVRQAIQDNAASGIKRVQSDEATVETHDLPALIEVDRYLDTQASNQKGRRGIQFTKLNSPGPV